ARIGKAGGAAGAVAGQTGAIVPAARVLGDVAADGGGIADLRAGHPAGCIGEHLELFADHFAVGDFRECRERTDFDPVGGLADTLKLHDAAEIHHDLGPLHAVLEPVEAVIAAGHLPGVLAAAIE